MAVPDRITSNLIEELLAADLPAPALQVYLALYRVSVLRRRRRSDPIPVPEIADQIGRKKSTVNKAIRELRAGGWLQSYRSGNRGRRYEVMTPELGSVWDASQEAPSIPRRGRKIRMQR